MNGSIVRLAEQGFGFISQEGEEKDVFFHSSSLVGVEFADLKVGDVVSFDLEDSEKGPRAVNVAKA
ncbi:MAG: cold shock domain-containing protein [Candidatus Uhrbacteria bacterium]